MLTRSYSFTDSELEIYKKMNNAMIQQIEELKKSKNEKEGKLFINGSYNIAL